MLLPDTWGYTVFVVWVQYSFKGGIMTHTATNESIVRQIQNGETQLIDGLIEANQGIINYAARYYAAAVRNNNAVDMDDLKQSAIVGILEAVPAWDETKGAFITVAMLYIKHSIRAAIGINTTKQRIENMPHASLNTPIDTEQETPLMDIIADNTAVNPEEAAIQADTRRIVRAAVSVLPERQYNAIKHILCGGPSVKDAKGRADAFTSLRRNINIIRLRDEYINAPYRHRGVSAWRYTHTSATEAAVLTREWVLESISRNTQGAGVS